MNRNLHLMVFNTEGVDKGPAEVTTDGQDHKSRPQSKFEGNIQRNTTILPVFSLLLVVCLILGVQSLTEYKTCVFG